MFLCSIFLFFFFVFFIIILSELPDLLRTNIKGEVNVDDFFYLTMMQWSKFTSISIARSHLKISFAEKNSPYGVKNNNLIVENNLKAKELKDFNSRKNIDNSKSSDHYDINNHDDEVADNNTDSRNSINGNDEKNVFSLTKSTFSTTFLNQFVESAYKTIGKIDMIDEN